MVLADFQFWLVHSVSVSNSQTKAVIMSSPKQKRLQIIGFCGFPIAWQGNKTTTGGVTTDFSSCNINDNIQLNMP